MEGQQSSRPAHSPLLAVFLFAATIPGASSADSSTPTDVAAEEAFLDLLQPLDLPAEIQPIPGARNEAFRDCRSYWPEGYAQAQSGPEARALRDIYALVRARNVIVTRDCGCEAKVADWDQVEAIAAALRESDNLDLLTWRETARVSEEADRLTVIAETLCGGAF